jgi:hypothetical protein
MERVAADGTRVLRLWGELEDCCGFVLRDCVRVVGMPVTGGVPLSAKHTGAPSVRN